jgi:site-specific DNA-methyltransferase (adenine-specific)
MQKNYKIKLGTQEIEITQDEDGKFIKPLLVIELEKEGTALKPACEPIVVARKPLSEKNVALNVLKWGTGGINIDDCRIGTEERTYPITMTAGNFETTNGGKNIKSGETTVQGRFPANIILDEEAGQMLDEQSGISKSSDTKRNRNTLGSFGMPNDLTPEYSDKGGASRFFYCAKASKSERNNGCEELEPKHIDIQQPHNSKDLEERYAMTSKNNHPTVKPVALMEYLIKLVSREGALILDPFLGSGTTAIASLKTNRKFIGIEKEADYVKIAEARIKPYLEQRKLEVKQDE